MAPSSRDRSPSEEPIQGTFSYEPHGPLGTSGDDDVVITVVRLRSLEHAGPFWDDEGHLSDDYDELLRWIGISRALFDDVMAWHGRLAATGAEGAGRHRAAGRELTQRLRREVHPHVEVRDPD